MKMMKGRGSATIMAALMVVVSVLLEAHYVQTATYIVGDREWGYNAVDWPAGKQFRTGDILVFKYQAPNHNVVEIDIEGFNYCKTPPGAKIYTSGNDHITLYKGQQFFMCNISTHCDMGRMKIAITAT